MSARFTPLDARTLDAAQAAVVREVGAGRRGTVPANVVTWLAHPELARRAAHLGELVRYETSLAPSLSELAILVVARHWHCAYEWAIHAGEAARAGVPAAVIEALGQGATPDLDPVAAVVVAASRQLLATGQLDDAAHDAALAALGDRGLTDLVAMVGYYTLVAFSLNARPVPTPTGAPVLPPR